MELQTTACSHVRCRGVPSPQPFPKSSLKGLHCDVGDVIQKSNSDVQWLHQLYIRWPGVLLLCEVFLLGARGFAPPVCCSCPEAITLTSRVAVVQPCTKSLLCSDLAPACWAMQGGETAA